MDRNQEKAPLIFGVLTDIQYADVDPEEGRFYRDSFNKLEEATLTLNAARPAFTLNLGDTIDREFSSFGKVMPLFKKLNHPVYHLAGNHDFMVKETEKDQVGICLEQVSSYYGFTSGSVRFLMLDTNEVSLYRPANGSPAGHQAQKLFRQLEQRQQTNAKPWNGGVSSEQLQWLSDELEKATAAHYEVIICSHHPLWPEDGHHAWNNRDILHLLSRYTCNRLCFSGHQHDGFEASHESRTFITFKSMVHNPQTTAYALVSLEADRLKIAGFGRETSREILVPKR